MMVERKEDSPFLFASHPQIGGRTAAITADLQAGAADGSLPCQFIQTNGLLLGHEALEMHSL